MKKINHKIILVLLLGIVLLGVFLRFNALSTNPPSLNWDEVAFGYNAHSILETGKDEFGKSYPLYFRSLDDYKLPVYVYMTVLSEQIFGYDNFAVRFPSALFGSLTIILFFFLTEELVRNKYIALLAALLLAILPWHIQFSRMAAEANVGLFFFFAGLLCFLYSIKKKFWLLPISIIFFALSQYTYLTFRFLVPLLGAFLVLLYRKELFRKNFYIALSCILVILFGIWLGFDIYSNRNTSRTSGIAAVTPLSSQYQQDIKELVYDGSLNINIPRKLFHDSHIFSTIDILTSGYLSHFSPEFLFFNAGQSRHYTPMFGVLYLWMVPFLLVGLYFMTKLAQKTVLLICALLIGAPLPAAFAFDVPNAIRTVALIYPFCIIAAIGIYELGKLLRKKNIIFVFLYCIVISVTILISFAHFYHQNTVHLPQERSEDWQYGRKEMTVYILQHQNEYKKIIISTKLEWPNIFYLYYSKYDPKKYLAQGGTRGGSWAEENNKIDTIEFHKFSSLDIKNSKNTLFIGKFDEFPSDTKPLKTISYLDGAPAIYIVSE